MKARTMVYLDLEQHKALKAGAHAEGISLAELVRRLVKNHLDKHEPIRPVPLAAYAKMVALGSSGRQDVSERHDTHLAQALWREHDR